MPQRENEVIIEAGRAGGEYWRDIWRYRELLCFFAWRDILVRYKQTVIGVAWSVIRPAATVAVFTLVFGTLGRFPSGGVPYPVLVLAALLPWQFFSAALSESSNSLVANASMLGKVYFPRLVVPAATVMVTMVDFLISFAALASLMAWYRVLPDWRALCLPLFFAQACCVSFGCGVWLAALNVRYRDFRHVVPFIVQLGLYASPVGFASEMIPDRWRLLYSLNPMVGVIDGFRWSLLGGAALYLPGILASLATTVLFLAGGLRYFRRTERVLADVI